MTKIHNIILTQERFLLTRPLRDVTSVGNVSYVDKSISTHTPLAGRDYEGLLLTVFRLQISTHTPLAGRDCTLCNASVFIHRFLLTRPLRDVTSYAAITEFQ